MSHNFRYLLRVRYSECDAQGVVFNAKYAEYADVAVTEFMRAIWGDYLNLSKRGLDNQVVDLHIQWLAPAKFDDVIQIDVETIRLGNSSYTVRSTFSLYESQTPESQAPEIQSQIATADITYVMVSTPEFKKCNVPDDLRKALELGAVDTLVDHAGTGV
jgi:acyl-CoA thioester hydrolase